jgi:hypothetical protein
LALQTSMIEWLNLQRDDSQMRFKGPVGGSKISRPV